MAGEELKHQLEVWQSEFGDAYTDRNLIDWRTRIPAFRQMLAELPIDRVLEVGCNRGHNLVAFTEILEQDCVVVGLEPNKYAIEIARQSSPRVRTLRGNVSNLCFRGGYFDLVATIGVLIHIPPTDLAVAISEIYRVSRRYILSVEYFAEAETPIHYRGYNDLLWKRDFGHHFRSQFPDLTLIRSGFWRAEDGFDDAHWWLLEKSVGRPKP